MTSGCRGGKAEADRRRPQAYLRADYGAAVRLLERAAALAPAAGSISPSKPTSSTHFTGQATATKRYGARNPWPSGHQLRAMKWANCCGKLQMEIIRMSTEPEGAAERLAALAERAHPVFEAADDTLPSTRSTTHSRR